MSNKKVVIITRTGEYLTENGEIVSNRQIFGEKIKEQLNEQSKNNCVKKFLAVADLVNDYEKKEGGGKLMDYFAQFGIRMMKHKPEDRPLKEYEIRIIGIREMLINNSEAVSVAIKPKLEGIGRNNCYVTFECKNDDENMAYEVTLLLWDKLTRDSSEQIIPFGLFVEQICKDCGITSSDSKDTNIITNNILYIHDCQLFGHQLDKTIWNRSDPKFKGGYEDQEYFPVLKNCFDYVATFGHLATRGIFKNQILQLKFGPSLADMIASKEKDAVSFKDLRTKINELFLIHG